MTRTNYSYSINILRPMEQVFTYMSEVEHLRQWIDGLESITPLTEGGNRVGAKARHVYQENGRTIEMIEEMLVYEPPRCIKFKGTTNDFEMITEYILTPTTGGTRLEFDSKLTSNSWLFKLLAPLMARMTKGKLVADLERLKTLVEQGEN